MFSIVVYVKFNVFLESAEDVPVIDFTFEDEEAQ